MQRTALVSADGTVQHVVMAGPNYDAPPGFRAVPTNMANVGDHHEGGAFVAAGEPTLPIARLMMHARRRRSVVARAGFSYDVAVVGQPPHVVRISTTVEHRADLAEMAHLAAVDATRTFTWTDEWGSAQLTAAQVIDLRTRLAEHVVATHVSLADALNAVQAGAATTRRHVEDRMGVAP